MTNILTHQFKNHKMNSKELNYPNLVIYQAIGLNYNQNNFCV